MIINQAHHACLLKRTCTGIWCQQFTRGFLNNIPDILVKFRGSGVKVRFEPSFGREKYDSQSGINH